jgi:tetratricopeptide (TPR) repeat protein
MQKVKAFIKNQSCFSPPADLFWILLCHFALCTLLFDAALGQSQSTAGRYAAQEAAAIKKEELELAARLMKEFPDSEEPLVLMGNILIRHGNSAEGILLWEKVLQTNPRRPDVYDGMGWIALAKGEYQEAISWWRKALGVNPKMPGVRSGIARALMALGNASDAVKELEEEVKISPRSGFSFFLLGQQYLEQKNYEKARKNYEAAIAVEPNNTRAYYGLYTVYTRLNQPQLAQKYLASFKKLKQEDMNVLKDRNDAYNDLINVKNGAVKTYIAAAQIYAEQARQSSDRQKKLQEAEGLFKKAATIDPNSTEPLMQLAQLYRATARVSEALEMYKKIAVIEPKNPVSFLNMGLLYGQTKQITEAQDCFVKVIKLAPESSDGFRELAQLYLRGGMRLQDARKLAEKAVELEPIAINYMVLSRACDKNGDIAGAISAIKKAVDLEPNIQLYRQIYEALQKRK